jgi:DNA-binding NtrC family response regulator
VLRVFPSETAPVEKEVERFSLPDPAGDDIRELIVRSDAFLKVIEKARTVARSTVPVLIQGESGTGKELLARLIHEHSPRCKNRFVQINCAAFSETLIESEMFGHERGAFTGADQRHAGYFERAHEGSLLLDEIGEMPLKMQAKLLRVLEESAFERVGGEQLLRVNVRVIATTNRDLEQEIARGMFRNDLYFRLNAVLFHIPPLRVRPQDILPLLRHFVARFGKEGAVEVTSIAPAAQEMLLAYAWPGNVRQLRNVIHHACVMARGCRIEPDDLPPLPQAFGEPSCVPPNRTLAEMERQKILETLREVGGNRTAAALRLGVTTRTLQNKLRRYREDEAA